MPKRARYGQPTGQFRAPGTIRALAALTLSILAGASGATTDAATTTCPAPADTSGGSYQLINFERFPSARRSRNSPPKAADPFWKTIP